VRALSIFFFLLLHLSLHAHLNRVLSCAVCRVVSCVRRVGGFVWIYSALHYLTGGGADIRLAQYIFGGLYLAVLALVLAIYHRTPTVPTRPKPVCRVVSCRVVSCRVVSCRVVCVSCAQFALADSGVGRGAALPLEANSFDLWPTVLARRRACRACRVVDEGDWGCAVCSMTAGRCSSCTPRSWRCSTVACPSPPSSTRTRCAPPAPPPRRPTRSTQHDI
jgi:hypothetical protein